jgi:hypothetical protein
MRSERERRPHCGLKCDQRARHITPEVHPERTTVAFRQDLEISPRLGRLYHAEGVGLTGHRKIERVVTRELQETPFGGPPL